LDHDDAGNVSTTPYVQYAYSGIADGFRPISVVYPSGKTISYNYDNRNDVMSINEGGFPVVLLLMSSKRVGGM